MKRFQTVETYLKDMFGEQFVQFTKTYQDQPSFTDADYDQKVKLANHSFLKGLKNDIEFPDFNSYPYHVKEIFQYFRPLIKKDDLQKFFDGTLLKQNILNVYFKILEKINLVN